MFRIARALVVASLVGVGVTQSGLVTGAPRDQALFRGRVVVGEDGNGVTAGAFRTTVEGEAVRYVMLVENGTTYGGRPRPPVETLQVTLNGDVVFQDAGFMTERVDVTLNPAGDLNQMVIEAGGSPGSGASVAVFALQPMQQMFGGRSILPWAWTDPLTRIVVHNAGPSAMTYRLLFFNPDGTVAGQTPSAALNGYAALTLNGTAIVASHGIQWQNGAVHIQWVSRGMTRMSAVAIHREPDDPGNLEVVARGLALDDYGPYPVTRQQFEDVAGVQIIPQ